MTFASIATALPLATALAFVVGWSLKQLGWDTILASLTAFSMALLVGVAILLSDSPAGLLRAVWPREAADWLGIAAALLAGVAALQKRPVPIARMTLVLGILLGILIVCRLMFGSVYLRPGHTAMASLAGIALAGALIGLAWHIELARCAPHTMLESLANAAVSLGAAIVLGTSGSFQYGTIGMLVTLCSCAAWIATRQWPWVANLVVLMLLGLGMAFAELTWQTLVGSTLAIGLCGLFGLIPATSNLHRRKPFGLAVVIVIVAMCVGLNGQRFMQEVKGKNAGYDGYEAYK